MTTVLSALMGRQREACTLDIRDSEIGPESALPLPSLVVDRSQEMEERLAVEVPAREPTLLQEFRRVASRSNGAVVAFSDEVVVTNITASGLLDPADHALLRERAAEALIRRQQLVEGILLSGDREVSVRCLGVTEGDGTVGAVLEFVPPISEAPRIRNRRTGGQATALVGRSMAYKRMLADIDHHAGHRQPLLITGEAGVGKRAVARSVHERATTGENVSVFDAALCGVEDPSDWLRGIGTWLAEPTGTVIIPHAELLKTTWARALCCVIESTVRSAGARLIATWTDGPEGSDARRFLLDRFPCRMRVPPLRERSEDVPDLVGAFVGRHGAAHAGGRFSPEVLQALTYGDWPGNVRELECLVCSLLLRRRRGDIALEDLPAQYHSTETRGPLTRMERLERDAIVTALRACGGNRIEAAASLGISRSTLYRKIKGFRISPVPL